ncbi:MAG: AEC family transporter [Clostridia bacterium]|nr:AEC family transporter [Clostridia bacterium]
MDSLIFALNAVMPIVVMVGIGYAIKKAGFMNDTVTRAVNKMVFRFFLPAMLFLNIYEISDLADIQFGYIIYGAVATILMFLISLPLVILYTKHQDRRGPLLQSTFRSNNALIGVPLAEALCGSAGVVAAALLSAVVIPLYNVLAVISLSLFSGNGGRPNVKKMLMDILKNPLIQSIALALAFLGVRVLFVKLDISFRLSDVTILFKVLRYLSNLATPMALLALGAQFEFSAIKELRREIIFGTAARTVVWPLLSLGVAYFFFRDTFTAAQFAVFISIFATPVAVSSVPMTQEMGGDVGLAGQLVVWSTLISSLSIFFSCFILRLVGIFS